MSEYQVSVVVALFVVIALAIGISIPIDHILKRLRNIEKLLTLCSKQDTDNKDEVSDGDSKDE